ncbi:MAG: amidase family protein, partial [Frankiaceae bacterium]
MRELLRLPATEIAAAVAKGDLSAVEVTRVHLDRIAGVDGEVAAFLHVDAAGALAAARSVDEQRTKGEPLGPLAGVPIAIKDVLTTRGVPTTCGSRILDGWRPPYDATVVRKVRAAGLIPLGKANMDEFAMGSSTENSAFRP